MLKNESGICDDVITARGYRTIIATASGDPATDYLSRMGFERTPGDGTWILRLRQDRAA